jgi:hypothetical protein
LQPWLYIFDQGILWLTMLCFAFEEGRKPSTKNTIPIEFLIGTACVQANSIRMLCVQGFDLPAKAVLRTFLETLLTCVILIHDEDLRKRYKEAQLSYDSWRFWNKHFREKKLLAKIREIFLEHGVSDEIITEFTDWIKDEFRTTSQAIHPTYVAAAFATRPFPLVGEIISLGIFGAPTVFSHRTLSVASRFLWFFSMVASGLLLTPLKGKRKPLLKLRKRTDTSKLFATSYSIFWKLVQDHWNDELNTANL